MKKTALEFFQSKSLQFMSVQVKSIYGLYIRIKKLDYCSHILSLESNMLGKREYVCVCVTM